MVDLGLPRMLHQVDAALSGAIRRFEPAVLVREEGRVLSVRDGVAAVSGLRAAALDELVQLGDREWGLVLGLSGEAIEVVLLGPAHALREGSRVRCTGRALSLPVGENALGRVIDALGQPLDGKPLLGPSQAMLHHRAAPQIYERDHIRRPLMTGILAIDAMFPIGRGQRELILGDEGTGKTALALDVMLRQRDTSVVSVYVAIGRRRAEVSRIARQLHRAGGEFVIVAAPEDTSVAMRYLAPYAGCAVAEYFMDRGRDALVIYDDLSAHAIAWRELSLLLRRPPGREAYPGDIFYQHSRLLERATQLAADRGGGSLTALPIARLESGRLSAYIPTNLISITDGQLVLSQTLFAAGQKPAIDSGLSVSRIGAKAQPGAIRSVAAKLRLEFASFLEIESFARLGTRLDATAERRISWGRRLRRLLRAPRFRPLSLFDEVVMLVFASEQELFLQMPEPRVPEAAAAAARRLRDTYPSLAERVEQGFGLAADDRRLVHEALVRAVAEIRPAEGGTDV